jgi:DNA adenine methylase
MRARTKAQLRSPLKWHGGKSYIAGWINSLLPQHGAYVEPFAGGLSVLLNKRRCAVEVAGDLDPDLIRFWTCLRDEAADLAHHLKIVEYSRGEFERACDVTRSRDPDATNTTIEAAAAFLARNRMSRGGLGRSFAWSERLRGGRPGDLNAWHTIQEILPTVASRLRHVEFYCADAFDLIAKYDDRDTLYYLDPPYLHATRTARGAYTHEMSDEAHRRLLDVIADVRGKVVLSGYGNPLYDHALRSWERHEFERPNDSGQTKVKTRRVEVVWLNAACERFGLSASPIAP